MEAFPESVKPKEVKKSARTTWNRARACRTIAGTSFEGNLKKILKDLEHQNIKMSHKIESRID